MSDKLVQVTVTIPESAVNQLHAFAAAVTKHGMSKHWHGNPVYANVMDAGKLIHAQRGKNHDLLMALINSDTPLTIDQAMAVIDRPTLHHVAGRVSVFQDYSVQYLGYPRNQKIVLYDRVHKTLELYYGFRQACRDWLENHEQQYQREQAERHCKQDASTAALPRIYVSLSVSRTGSDAS